PRAHDAGDTQNRPGHPGLLVRRGTERARPPESGHGGERVLRGGRRRRDRQPHRDRATAMSAGRAALALLAALGLWTAPAAGHEERLLVGRVERSEERRVGKSGTWWQVGRC